MLYSTYWPLVHAIFHILTSSPCYIPHTLFLQLKKKGDVQLERWDIDGRQVFFYFEEVSTSFYWWYLLLQLIVFKFLTFVFVIVMWIILNLKFLAFSSSYHQITPAQLCFNMTMDQDSIVDKKQPTFVRVQDYYEPQHEATVEYCK